MTNDEADAEIRIRALRVHAVVRVEYQKRLIKWLWYQLWMSSKHRYNLERKAGNEHQ